MSADEAGRRPIGEGAAQEAPTAPHATPRPREGAARRTGPERFWWRRPVSVAFLFALAFSLLVHGSAFPIEWPTALEINDVDGEAAIAVDLLQGPPLDENPPAPVEAPAPVEPPAPSVREMAPATSSKPAQPEDAGSRAREAGAGDAGYDAEPDGAAGDGSAASQRAADAGAEGGGAAATESIGIGR